LIETAGLAYVRDAFDAGARGRMSRIEERDRVRRRPLAVPEHVVNLGASSPSTRQHARNYECRLMLRMRRREDR
jgi:hypothetical protein